jgi:hypothetical protein
MHFSESKRTARRYAELPEVRARQCRRAGALTLTRQQIQTSQNQSPQLALRLIVARRDERASAVNRDDQALVP